MPENAKPNNERPADLAVQDSVGGMARRLLNPAHLRDLAGRSAVSYTHLTLPTT